MEENKISEEKIIEERTKKTLKFFKNNPSWIFYIVLILIVILGIYIRYLPLSDHGGRPGLWDITTNDYTLGPDLDPFLFLRYSKTMIENGSLPTIDTMRNVPLGFDNSRELQMVSYMIVLTYHMVNMFGHYSINYAAAYMPVWVFALTIIVFFLFIKEIFLRKNDKSTYVKACIIALIATLFMTIMPAFLSRTVAGIPEKESVGFFFMFLAFYLFLKAWKSEKIVGSTIYGILAGVITALMGLTWGGVSYAYVTIGLAGLIGFILNKFKLKETIAYCCWLIFSLIVLLTMTNRFNLKDFIMGLDTGLAFLVLGILIIHLLLWHTKLKSILGLEKIKLPKTIISIIIVIVLAIIALLVIDPKFIGDKITGLFNTLIKPITGRWNTTVAENRQPYFIEWYQSFGIWFFWLCFIGSVALFKRLFNKLEKKTSWILTGLYVLFFLGLVLSRYAAHPNLFDGESFISILFYFGSAILLALAVIYFYIKDHKQGIFNFEKIEYEYIFLFALFILTLFTARSAVRLIMVLVPIAPIFLSFLIVETGYKAKEAIKKEWKAILIIIAIIIIVISGYYALGYYNGIKTEAYNYVPYYYTVQWQEAMSWVRNNTPQNAVFAHWWDYGYWVQSIGNRATVTDGGNAISFWNYYVGRFVLTGDNQRDSLEFLYTHNASYLLIDSSDIGKYGAFSQIGSNGEFDRFSYGPVTLISDASRSQETSKGIIRIYQTNTPVDEDISYNENGTKIFLPGPSRDSEENLQYNSAIIGIIIEIINSNNKTQFKQPEAIYYYQGKQIKLPLRYLYVNGNLYDFKTGINAAISLIEKVDNMNNRLSVDKIGAGIYLSPRILRGFLGQVYILNNSMENFNNFKIVHVEPDYIIGQLNMQGAGLGEFVYYQGLKGPIKIWKINYETNQKANPEYLLTVPPSSITWKF